MKTFDEWIASGPLATEPLTQRERDRLKIAYLEGALAANESHIEALDRIAKTVPAARASA